MQNNQQSLDVNAVFLGPKSENQTFFHEMVDYAVTEHMHWRADFHPEDAPLVTAIDQHQPAFRETLYQTENILRDLSSRLKTTSVPWFSPRYLGHMNADTLMVSNIAYLMTMLYNPNNCAHESSPTTTDLENEVSRDLCTMFGYDPHRSWGHITSGGTIANFEGVWWARNLKSLPLAIAQHAQAKDLVAGLTEKQLLNLSPSTILDLADQLKARGIFEQVRDLTVRGIGVKRGQLGKFLVPMSKHYSWMKAMDVLGIGQENIVHLPVDAHYRTDVQQMREITFKLIEAGEPILGMVAVVGSTEEGAIDHVDEVVKLRKECEEKFGVSFYIHVDAAYGGYIRSLFLDENNRFLEYNALIRRYREDNLIPDDVTWPKREVYESMKAMAEVDSITVDPHKAGFVQYAAGAICTKDKRVIDLICYHAAYVFEEMEDGSKNIETKVVLGASIMEGSKSGATAAAVWAAHRLIPLNITGYGKVLGRGIVTAGWLTRKLAESKPFIVGNRQFEVRPVLDPDFHMVDFTFKEIGNNNLEDHNRLNKKMYEICSYATGRTYTNDFLTSSTSLAATEYGDTPFTYVAQRGFAHSEWDRIQSVYILRSAVMTHILRDPNRFESFWQELTHIFQAKLSLIVEQEEKLSKKEQTLTAA